MCFIILIWTGVQSSTSAHPFHSHTQHNTQNSQANFSLRLGGCYHKSLILQQLKSFETDMHSFLYIIILLVTILMTQVFNFDACDDIEEEYRQNILFVGVITNM